MRAVNTTRGTVLGSRVRVADSSLTRLVGLLGERELAPGDGLLIMPSQGVHTWGMRFAIDVVVLDDDWRALAVRPAMRPWRMTRLFFKSSAVLELPSGVIRSTSTSVGDVLDFSRVAATGS